MGGEAGAPRQPYELSSLDGDHIELRQIGANTAPTTESVAAIVAPLPPIARSRNVAPIA